MGHYIRPWYHRSVVNTSQCSVARHNEAMPSYVSWWAPILLEKRINHLLIVVAIQRCIGVTNVLRSNRTKLKLKLPMSSIPISLLWKLMFCVSTRQRYSYYHIGKNPYIQTWVDFCHSPTIRQQMNLRVFCHAWFASNGESKPYQSLKYSCWVCPWDQELKL